MIFGPQTLLYLVYVLVAAAVIIVVEMIYSKFSRRWAHTGSINYRLKKMRTGPESGDTLQTILKERGLDSKGDFAFGAVWLNRLYTQSGWTMNPVAFASTFLLTGAALMLALMLYFSVNLMLSALVGGSVMFVLPLLILRRSRSKRMTRFGKQLPDALDMIVRSLKAGHPAPIAIALVAQEMPDPIGSEFGIATDEISFGANLETAVKKLAERVGFEGLQLLAVSISIQAETGGNLTEILSNLSKVLRERQKLKLKIRSLSAEGRMSALLISLFPFVMFGVLMIIAPGFYGEVWGDPIILPVFACFGLWALFGDYIMYRMVNFDY